jgi:hypothetical protein
MDEKRFHESSPDTIDALNDERLRRSEENARGWRRNMVVLLLLLMVSLGYWFMR